MLIAIFTLYLKLCLFLGVSTAILTFYLWAYERGRGQDERLVFGGASADTVIRAVLMVLAEGLTWAVCIAVVPLGWIGDFLAAGRRADGQRPILLVHGYMHNRTAWLVFGPWLRLTGRTQLYTINLRPTGADLMEFARQVDQTAERICQETGSETIDYIGHSMGGVIGRLYVQHFGGSRRVAHLVTLGSPHHGTLSAALGPHANALQMATTSAISAEAATLPEAFNSIAVTSIYSTHDNVVVPAENAALPEPAENARVDHVGHAALLWSPQVWRLLCKALEREPAGDLSGEAAAAA